MRKPIYKKDILFNNTYSAAMNEYKEIFYDFSFIDKLLSYDFYAIGRDNGKFNNHLVNGMGLKITGIYASKFYILQDQYQNAGNSTYGIELKNITLEYTKTTDEWQY